MCSSRFFCLTMRCIISFLSHISRFFEDLMINIDKSSFFTKNLYIGILWSCDLYVGEWIHKICLAFDLFKFSFVSKVLSKMSCSITDDAATDKYFAFPSTTYRYRLKNIIEVRWISGGNSKTNLSPWFKTIS